MTQADAPSEEGGEYGAQQKPYAYYALLIALYNAAFGGFTLLYRGKKNTLDRVTGLDLLMLGLSTLRLSKLVSQDEITSVVREPFVKEEGASREPQGDGMRWAIGKLVLCPTCTGTWIAAFLTYGLHLFPLYTRPLLALASASGISQLGDAVLDLVYTDRNVLRRHES
ncbi:MAG TPA: DUF1360 domain-containing protein [Chloroflexota bacterium]